MTSQQMAETAGKNLNMSQKKKNLRKLFSCEFSLNSRYITLVSGKTLDVTELSIIDEKLARVSCPFTWGMKIGSDSVETETVLERREEIFQIVLDRQDYFPEMVLMYHLLMALKHACLDDLPKAVEYINNAEECLADIKTKFVLIRKQFYNPNTCSSISIITRFDCLEL